MHIPTRLQGGEPGDHAKEERDGILRQCLRERCRKSPPGSGATFTWRIASRETRDGLLSRRSTMGLTFTENQIAFGASPWIRMHHGGVVGILGTLERNAASAALSVRSTVRGVIATTPRDTASLSVSAGDSAHGAVNNHT